MNKIIIIGSPGSGKSTYANKLGQKLNLPVFHLDKIFWKNNWSPISQDEFVLRQEEIMKGERWILDGNFTKTIDFRAKKADTIIFFDYPKWLSLWRILKRYFIHFRNVRPDMGGNNKERLYGEHIRFILNYPRENVMNILAKYNDKNIIIFRNDKDVCKTYPGASDKQ
ncbi:hypothetical protein A3C89_01945 [Candidatus Kaiserbacteria bacterium RIFCSPHIGHO2_02_FULL_50_50]|uniref:Topology modulation protein n=1 Tax=Candidatus Kaiserbacteria bacterium RIFCSPHIGHO2_02_FULL_50_50 TaxID=1798492 RepID=A0A1F6DCJ9_9BACT|nr:MAG: hypothetical protein A3C89_01945 [Candidatus Kaiserbacteria bacterium RIFCSPHIGHO2_02_FULL_50_50]OGG89033.1 MAG: hypothetical protein A3G62_04345 [Candidatus Kaiserbacteria bacterium RIFCSPLOWO2_12_FULL_50_10]